MRITVQQGINANDLQQAIYETIRAGMECDARAAQLRHEARMRLIKAEPVAQRGLFDEVEA